MQYRAYTIILALPMMHRSDFLRLTSSLTSRRSQPPLALGHCSAFAVHGRESAVRSAFSLGDRVRTVELSPDRRSRDFIRERVSTFAFAVRFSDRARFRNAKRAEASWIYVARWLDCSQAFRASSVRSFGLLPAIFMTFCFRMLSWPNKSPEPTAVGAVQFRCRGSRRESAVAQLFSLGHETLL